MLKLLNLRSSITLHWLFQLVFPELGIEVEKVILKRSLKAQGIEFGQSALGNDAIFGKRAYVDVYGRKVTLISSFEATDFGISWPNEIKKRLDDIILPLLRSIEIDIEIVLIIKSQKRWAKLQTETYLGYDKIKGGEDSFRKIRIFQGRLEDVTVLKQLSS